MHTVDCPKCGKTLNVGKPVAKARMRCKQCGEVFVGSTTDTDPTPVDLFAESPQSPPPGAPQATPGGRPGGPASVARRPAPGNNAKAIQAGIAVAAGLAVLVLVVVVWWFQAHPKVRVYDPDTDTYVEKRVTRAEAERILEEQKQRKKRGSAVVVEDKRIVRRTPERTRPEQARTDDDTGQSSDPASQTPKPGDVITLDKTVRVSGLEMDVSGVSNAGFLKGELWNKGDEPIVAATLRIRGYNREGARGPDMPAVTVRYVPPHDSVPFSVRYSGYDADALYGYTIEVSKIDRDKSLVCVPVTNAQYDIKDDQDGSKILVVNAVVTNGTKTPILNPKVYCDFYSDTWIHEGSTGQPIALEGEQAEVFSPGEALYVEFHYDTGKGYLALRPELSCRLIGKKEF